MDGDTLVGTTTNVRSQALLELADAIVALQPGHPVRVGVDGPDAAGKTVLADELAAHLRARGRGVIRASIDRFHRARAQRYRRGRESPEGYYRDSFDIGLLRRRLLDPLGPGGHRLIRTAAFDFRTDQPVDEPPEAVPIDAVLVFDGVFLLRPELRDCWDLSIFVWASADERLSRSLVRDIGTASSAAELERLYRVRYLPGQELYLSEVAPQTLADVVVDNEDPTTPGLAWRQRPAPRHHR